METCESSQIFQKIVEKCKEKNIVKLCKKLEKSCSFTKSKDVENLCALAYWLYIYGYKDEVLTVCEFANLDIPERINYNIWTWILSIWGLHAHIHAENNNQAEKENKITNMKKVYSTPKRDGQTQEEAWEFYLRIANRITYEELCNHAEIERCITDNEKKIELSYRFTALFSMISYGVTGFYPALENNKEQLQKDIDFYISCLK